MGRLHDVLRKLENDQMGALKELEPEEQRMVLQIMRERNRMGYSPLLGALTEYDLEEPPVDPVTFVTHPDFLNMPNYWEFWLEELDYVLNPSNHISEWIIEGGIRGGKTTAAVVALLYKIYRLTLYKRPHEIYGLQEGTPIAFALFNRTERLALAVGYQRIQAFMSNSPYFKRVCKKKRNTEHLILPKSIKLLTGSRASHAVGMAIGGGLVDEANLYNTMESGSAPTVQSVTDMYEEISNRIAAQFSSELAAPGLMCLASQPRNEGAFLSQHRKKSAHKRHTHVTTASTWEVRNDTNPERFYVIVGNERFPSSIHDVKPDEIPPGCRLLDPPVDFRDRFEANLEGSIRDLGGVPTFGINNFISNRAAIDACVDESIPFPFKFPELLVGVKDAENMIIKRFDLDAMFYLYDKINKGYRLRYYPESPRCLHVDLALKRDAAAIGCVCIANPENIERSDDLGNIHTVNTYSLHTDFVIRLVNREGDEIGLSQIVEFLLWLYARGLPIAKVTYDGFQSAQSLQDLSNMGLKAGRQSVDVGLDPYESLRQSIIEGRLKYSPNERLVEELKRLELVIDGKKSTVDHPKDFSKDMADALCGATFAALHEPSAIPGLTPDVLEQYGGPESITGKGSYHITIPRSQYDDMMLGRPRKPGWEWDNDPFDDD